MQYIEIINNVLERCHDPAKADLVKVFINEAYQDLMSEFDWPFLQKEDSFNTIIGQLEYELASDCRLDGLKRFWNAADGKVLSVEEHGVFVKSYPKRSEIGSPDHIIPFGIGANGYPNVMAYPIADAVYTINYAYLMMVNDLVENADVPAFSAEFHKILEERALAIAYEHEDESLFNLALRKYNYLLKKMKRRFSTAVRGQTFSLKLAADVIERRAGRRY